MRTCERCERSWYSVKHLDEEEAICPECGGLLLPAEDDEDDAPPSAA